MQQQPIFKTGHGTDSVKRCPSLDRRYRTHRVRIVGMSIPVKNAIDLIEGVTQVLLL